MGISTRPCTWCAALEQLQSLILPAFIARPLLRHYPDPHRKLARACHIYLGLLTG